MADKDFRVKNRLHVNGLTQTSGVILATNNALDSHTNLPTQYGGTGTTQSPAAGQVLFSSAGTTYTPTTLTSLDVKGATYSANAPASPFVGQVWIESDVDSDSFDPNIIRRKTITATAGQTTFNTDLEFIQGYEQVYFNGMLLLRTTDYTTPSNTSVELAAAAAAGDIVEILSITNLNSINAATTTTNTFTGVQVIDTSSSSAALRITQTGSGESLRVEDSANPDSTPFIIDSIGGVGIGTSSIPNWVKVDIASTGILRHTYTGAPAGVLFGQYDSSGNAYILNQANQSLMFGTNNLERVRITSSGNVGIGTPSPAAKLHVGRNTMSLITGVNAVFNADTNSSLGGIQINSWDDDSKRFSIVNSNGGTSILSNGANAYLIIGTDSSQPLYFYTNNTNRMALESNGNLSLYNAKSMLFYNPINTGAGSIYCAGGGSLTMASYGQPMITLHEDSEIRFFVGTGTQRAVINNAGELLIGYTSDNGAYRLQVNSQIFATSSTIATSDGRFKENISTIESGLNIIDSLRPVSFTWKEHPKHNFVAGKTVGFIAQEVKEALSDYDWIDNIIKTNISAAVLDEEGNEVHPEEEFLGIAEGNLIPLLVAAVKELKSRVETLEANNV